MSHEFVIICVSECAELDQAHVVAHVPCQSRFGHGLLGLSQHPGDQQERVGAARIPPGQFIAGGLGHQLQHGLMEADPRFTDGELGGVHRGSDTSSTTGHVVARERALMALVEASILGQRERVRRNDQTARERLLLGGWQHAMRHP